MTYSARTAQHLQSADLSHVTVKGIALHLGISLRSLHRHLRSERSTYNSIKATERQCRVLEALASNPDIEAAQLAMLTGYSEAKCLTRAFAEWMGITLTEFKARANQF